MIGGGSENHLLLVDLTPTMGPGAGIFVQKALDVVGLTLNKNTVPDELSSPYYPSGVRLGTPASTTRGMKEKEMKFIGAMILKVVDEVKSYRLPKEKLEKGPYIKQFLVDLQKIKNLRYYVDR